MLSISSEFRFAAAHHLSLPQLSPEENKRVFGSCLKLHGHNYVLRVTLCGTPNQYGWLLDFSELKAIVQRYVLDDYDHADLNALPDYQNIPTTAENMAAAIYRRLKLPCQRENCRLLRVSVFESADSWVSWEEDHVTSV